MSEEIRVEMNFCRRCGSKLTYKGGSTYLCDRAHTIFLNVPSAVGIVLTNNKHEVLMLERAADPGKGTLGVPGGFCDGPESLEEALAREVEEEVGLQASDYSAPQYVVSVIDLYDFGGEVLPVEVTIFTATVTTRKQPTAGDDAAAINWTSLTDLDLGKVYFVSARQALAIMRKRQTNA